MRSVLRDCDEDRRLPPSEPPSPGITINHRLASSLRYGRSMEHPDSVNLVSPPFLMGRRRVQADRQGRAVIYDATGPRFSPLPLTAGRGWAVRWVHTLSSCDYGSFTPRRQGAEPAAAPCCYCLPRSQRQHRQLTEMTEISKSKLD